MATNWVPSGGAFIDPTGTVRAPQIIYGNQVGVAGGGQAYQSDLTRTNTGAQQANQAAAAARLAAGAAGALTDVQGSPIHAGMIGAAPVAGAQISMGGFDAAQRAQNNLAAQGNQAISGLSQAARGAVPSAAELQGRIQLQQAQANAMSMAASARGGADSRAAAQRQAMQTSGQMGSQVIAQQAALRAQEQATARAQLAGAIGQQQGLAQGQGAQMAQMAQTQAGMQQQANLANQGAMLQAAQANQGASLDAQQSQASALLNARNLQSQMLGQAAGAWQNNQNMAQSAADFNNQVSQQDFNRQMAMQGQLLQQYGIEKNVEVQAYQADQARQASDRATNANILGKALDVGGKLVVAYGDSQ